MYKLVLYVNGETAEYVSRVRKHTKDKGVIELLDELDELEEDDEIRVAIATKDKNVFVDQATNFFLATLRSDVECDDDYKHQETASVAYNAVARKNMLASVACLSKVGDREGDLLSSWMWPYAMYMELGDPKEEIETNPDVLYFHTPPRPSVK